jgi:hypothetical protein
MILTVLTVLICTIIIFVLGIRWGYKWCTRESGELFQSMFDEGVVILKTLEGWDGTEEAFQNIKKWMLSGNI